MARSANASRWAELAILLLLSGPSASAVALEQSNDVGEASFPSLPLPPDVDGLIGLPPAPPASSGLPRDGLIQAALRHGLPPAVAEAVAFIESRNNSSAVGADGEVGLMQILPATAIMLGHTGPLDQLFEPEINIRYGVLYLAQAWRLANGDLCRALMKYRAGHGEERMTALSVRYCNQARAYLAGAASPSPDAQVSASDVERTLPSPFTGHARSIGNPVPPRWMLPGWPGRPRTAEDSRRFWAAHEARIKLINARLSARFQSAKAGS
jgi:soluble lytic murein transglycosylase-like protein